MLFLGRTSRHFQHQKTRPQEVATRLSSAEASVSGIEAGGFPAAKGLPDMGLSWCPKRSDSLWWLGYPASIDIRYEKWGALRSYLEIPQQQNWPGMVSWKMPGKKMNKRGFGGAPFSGNLPCSTASLFNFICDVEHAKCI